MKRFIEGAVGLMPVLLMLAILWVVVMGSWAIFRVATGACPTCLRRPAVGAEEK